VSSAYEDSLGMREDEPLERLDEEGPLMAVLVLVLVEATNRPSWVAISSSFPDRCIYPHNLLVHLHRMFLVLSRGSYKELG
jgi:hypothetical protein